MFGAIVGDTVGSVYEFNNTKDYNFKLFLSKSTYTDDTIMTLAVARWLLDDPQHSYQSLEEEMVTLAENFRCPMGGYGETFNNWLFTPEVFQSPNGNFLYKSATGRHPYWSWGNGSAMRASACGWWADTIEETERIAKISSEITHNHPEGIKGAQATAAAIFLARTGKSMEDIRTYITERFGYDLSHTWEEIQPGYEWDSSCQGTVPQAIICFLDSIDFEDAIRKAVSMGGDSDTLACITGGMAEAFYDGVPEVIAREVWIRLPLELKDTLVAFSKMTPYSSIFNAAEFN